jgi:hypothetical protein
VEQERADAGMAGAKPMKRRIKGGDEEDVHTRWRRLFLWTQRAGATSKVKRRTRRRERREGKREVREVVDE